MSGNWPSTNSPIHFPQLGPLGDEFITLDRSSNQPASPASSHGPAALSADNIRQTNPELHHDFPTTRHLEHSQTVVREGISTIQSRIDPANHVAAISGHHPTAALAQPEFNQTPGPTASQIMPLPLDMMSTTGQARLPIRTHQGEEPRSPDMTLQSIEPTNAGPPLSSRPTNNSEDTSQSSGQDIRLSSEGPNCVRGLPIENNLMKLIETYVKGHGSIPNVTAMNLGPVLAQFYAYHARPAKFSNPGSPSKDNLEDIICNILEDDTKSSNSKCRNILREVDLLHGRCGWYVPRDIDHDSGVFMSMSQEPQSLRIPQIYENPAAPLQHDGKRPREETPPDATVHKAPDPKRYRVEASRIQQPLSPQISQQGFSQSPSNSQTEQKSCLEPECGKSLKGMKGIMQHTENVHFPATVSICHLEANGKPCNEMKIRKDNFFGVSGHFWQRHSIDPNDKELKTELSAKLHTFDLENSYHDVCTRCRDRTELSSRKEFLDHMRGHYDGRFETGPYLHRCSTNHSWKNNRSIPEEYLENTMRKKSSGSCRGNGFGDFERTCDSDSDDDNGTGPSGKGISREAGSGCGNGNVGRESDQSSASTVQNYNYYNGGGNHQCRFFSGHAGKSKVKARLCPTLSDQSPVGTSDIKTARRSFKFKWIRQLGRGGCGTVDEVLCKTTNETYARKAIALRKTISTELEILKRIHHRHIINLAGACTTADQLWLFITPVAEKDLGACLRDYAKGELNGPDRKLLRKWSSCIVCAVEYLHESGFVHGDIKPQNVLISSDQRVYLADFGSAKGRYFGQTHGAKANSVSVLTPKYCAPEVYYGSIPSQNWPMGTASDIFSLGGVIAEMETVYTGQSIEAFETFRSAGSGNPAFKASLSRTYLWMDRLWLLQELMFLETYPHTSRFLQIVKDMLSFDPLRRPKTKDLAASIPCICDIKSSSISNTSFTSNALKALPGFKHSTSLQLQHQLPSRKKQSSVELKMVLPTHFDFVFGKALIPFPQKQSNVNFEMELSSRFDFVFGKASTPSPEKQSNVDLKILGCPSHFDFVLGRKFIPTSDEPYIFGSKDDDHQPVSRLWKHHLLNGNQSGLDEINRELPGKASPQLTPQYCDLVARKQRALTHATDPRDKIYGILGLIPIHQSYPSGFIYGAHSLENYLDIISPPSTAGDTINLWKSALFLLVDKRFEIESPPKSGGGDVNRFQCYHMDLKPENIIIISSDSKSPYEWEWRITDFGISRTKTRPNEGELMVKGESFKYDESRDSSDSYRTTTCEEPGKDHNTSFDIKRPSFGVWSLGCIYIEMITWLVLGADEIAGRRKTHNPPTHRPPTQNEAGLNQTDYEARLNEAKQKVKEDLLSRLNGFSDPVTQSIAESVIAPMFDPLDEPPDEPSILKQLYDKGQTILNGYWNDYKKTLTKAMDPLRSLVRRKGSFSSTQASHGSYSDQAETIVPCLDTDIDPNISCSSKKTLPYSVERFLRDESDYRSYLVSEYVPHQESSAELHQISLRSVVGRAC